MRKLLLIAGGLALAATVALADMYQDASNAKLPEARANLLQTPAVCDGYTAGNGAISGGSQNFTSATASFTAADVGKPITIAGAGTQYRVSSSSLSAGGTGHAVGDVVTLDSGIAVKVRAVAAGAVTSWSFTSLGDSGATHTTRSQVSTTGAGTGLVLNTTFEKKSLITTISAVTGPTAATLAAPAATTVTAGLWGYGTDYGPVIQAALDADLPVSLPVGVCGHAGTLIVKKKAILLGQGSGLAGDYPTSLMWLGADGGTQVQMDVDAQGGVDIIGVQTGNYSLDGQKSAGTAMKIRGVQGSQFYPTEARRHTMTVMDFGGASTRGSFRNRHYQLEIRDTALTADGLLLERVAPDGVGYRSYNANVFDMVRVEIGQSAGASGTGIICNSADHNNFNNVRVRTLISNYGIALNGSVVGDDARCAGNLWGLVDPGDGGLIARATGYVNPSINKILNYDRQNTPGNYVVEPGARLTVQDSNGRWFVSNLTGLQYGNLPTSADNGTLAYLNNSAPSTQPGAPIAPGGGSGDALAWKDGAGIWRVLSTPGPRASANVAHQSPAGTTSTAWVMMGLGATATVTPTNGGTVLINAWGIAQNSTAGNATKVRLRYGTGTAPANGVAQVGDSACSNTPNVTFDSSTATQRAPFSMTCVVGGLAVGTPHWIDLSVSADPAGTATVGSVSIQAAEL